MTTTIYDVSLCPGLHQFHLPDGRTMRVYVMDPEKVGHACVDIWTTRGRDDEPVSRMTGDTTRAAMGMFAWRNGTRFDVRTDPTPESHDWPAIATISLLWDLEKP